MSAEPFPAGPVAVIIGALVFAALGSLLGAAQARLAAHIEERPTYRGRSFWTGRSICPACGAELGARDLVPLVSWLALRARCRACGSAIAPDYLAIELGSVMAFLAAYATEPSLLRVAAVGLLGAVMTALAVVDLRHRLLPDALSLPLVALGLATASAGGPGPWPTLIDAAIGAVIGAGLVYGVRAVHRRLRGVEGIGLGDVKLMGVAGAWVGWQGLGSVLLLAAAGTLAAVGLVRVLGRARQSEARIPFGPGLAAAIFLVVLLGPLAF